MSLTPTLQAWLDELNPQVAALRAAGFEPTPTNARDGLANLTRGFVTEEIEVAYVKEFCLSTSPHAVPVRLYTNHKENNKPLIVYCHGGGHMSGSVTVYDPICKRISAKTGATVVSLDYRLAPECPYPAGLNDLRSALQCVLDDCQSRGFITAPTIVLGGDSGGGAMTTTVCAEISVHTGTRPPVIGQFLIYPSVDYQQRFDSIKRNGAGYLLEAPKIEWYFQNYFADKALRATASPIDKVIGPAYPPTLILSAQYDPLVDEAQAFAQLIQDSGKQAQYQCLAGMIHGFLNLEDLCKEACQESYSAIAEFVNAL